MTARKRWTRLTLVFLPTGKYAETFGQALLKVVEK